MSDNETNVKFGANISELKDGMAQASAAVSKSVSSMLESITGLSGAMKALSGLIATALSGAAIKGAIDSATSYNASILQLSRVMGTTTEQASVLSTAIHMIGGTTDEYTSMIMRLGMHIKDGGAEFERWGITVKDANGNFLSQQEIFDNVITRMDQMKSGTDANELALATLGRGAKEAYKYVDNLKDAMATAAEVTAKLGPITAAEAAQTKAASHEMNVATGEFSRMGQIIGADMLPSIATFTTMITDVAAAALPFLITAINAVLIPLEGLAATARMSAMIVVQAFRTIVTMAAGVAAALAGPWSEAGNTIKKAWADVIEDTNKLNANLEADMTKTAARINFLWSGTMKKVTPKAPGTATAPPPKEKEKEDKSRMPEWEEQYKEGYLADEQAHGGYLEKKLSEELAYWEKIAALPGKSATETLAVARKITDLKIAQYKEEYDAAQAAAAEIKKIEELKQDSVKQGATAAIAAKKEQLNTEVALGQISKEAEMASLKSFLDQEYALELAAAQNKLKLMEQGTAEYQRQLNVMTALQAKYALDVQKVEGKGAIATQQEWKKAIQPITQAFDTSVMGIIQGTQTLKKGLANLFQSITLSFINDTIKTMLSNWLFGENQKLAITALYSKMLVALGITTAAETATAKAAIETPAAISSITKNAGVAASGAAASQASIPYIGPALAVAAAAAMIGMVMGYMKFASAAGGFDVPSGIDPVTQLHGGEMVLPANLAENVRNMTGGGRSTINLQCWDSRDVKSFLKGNNRNLAGAAKMARQLGVR
jgi:hypothetical protein